MVIIKNCHLFCVRNLNIHRLNLGVPVELNVLPELVQQMVHPLHNVVAIKPFIAKQKLLKSKSESLLQSEKSIN